MKHKIFIFSLFALITIGSFTMADYKEPTATAPDQNTTSAILKTGPADQVVTTYEKIGIGDGTNQPSVSLLKNGGSYILLGGDSDKFVAIGASKVNAIPTSQTKSPNDFMIKTPDVTKTGKFDQFINITKYNENNPTIAKPLEAFIAGRYISKLAVTDTEDNPQDPTKRAYNPAYDLDLQATNTFNPTTNIGLGNTCNLYPGDMGNSLDVGGCPSGSYMSMYKAPTYTGTLSSTNNNTNTIIAQCTYFNPSPNPKNTGDCYTPNVVSTSGKTYIFGSRIAMLTGATLQTKQTYFPANFDFVGNFPTPGQCNFTAVVFKYEFMNPKMTMIEKNGSTIVKQSGPTATDSIQNFVADCNNKVELIITDDYGQYYFTDVMNSQTNILGNWD